MSGEVATGARPSLIDENYRLWLCLVTGHLVETMGPRPKSHWYYYLTLHSSHNLHSESQISRDVTWIETLVKFFVYQLNNELFRSNSRLLIFSPPDFILWSVHFVICYYFLHFEQTNSAWTLNWTIKFHLLKSFE